MYSKTHIRKKTHLVEILSKRRIPSKPGVGCPHVQAVKAAAQHLRINQGGGRGQGSDEAREFHHATSVCQTEGMEDWQQPLRMNHLFIYWVHRFPDCVNHQFNSYPTMSYDMKSHSCQQFV